MGLENRRKTPPEVVEVVAMVEKETVVEMTELMVVGNLKVLMVMTVLRIAAVKLHGVYLDAGNSMLVTPSQKEGNS